VIVTTVQPGKISSYDALADELIHWCVYWISSQFIRLQIHVVGACFARVWMRVIMFFQSSLQELLERNCCCLSNSRTHLYERSPTDLCFHVPELNAKTVNSRFEWGNILEARLFCCEKVHI